MKNYICINGQKAELTEEQLKQLGIELPKANPFARVRHGEEYYVILGCGEAVKRSDHHIEYDNRAFDVANYCADKAIMEQRALHETLNRLLWRYSMEHDGDKIKWVDRFNYKIIYNHLGKNFEARHNDCFESFGSVYFRTQEIAEAAIKEIIEPFMAAHPEFKF